MLIGGDIEFELVNPKLETLSASAHYDMYYTEDGEVGHDGVESIGEIRPLPAHSPELLLERIYRLFDSVIKEVRLFVNLNTTVHPCGMHIHFSYACERHEPFLQSIAPLAHLHGLFSNLPAQRTRDEYEYGYPFDVRRKAHGFEYRGFPSVVLAHPDLALKVLELAYDSVRSFSERKAISVSLGSVEKLALYVLRDKLFYSSVPLYYRPVVIPPSNASPEFRDFCLHLEEAIADAFDPPFPIVSFYSLHARRGIVTAGFSIPSVEEIPHPFPVRKRDAYRLGIPFAWKKRGVPELVQGLIKEALLRKIEEGKEGKLQEVETCA